MDRYQRVEKPRADKTIDENEIRITSQGRMRSYISYAMTLLQEKGSNEIVFKAMGRAINKTVTIVELIKRRIVGLHQITSIGSTDITDTWEPLEEGLLPLETTRHVSMITINLSKKELNTSSAGYQPPLPAEQVKAFTEFEYEGDGSPRGRGRGRGGRGRARGRGNGFVSAEHEDGGWDRNRGYPRGRGRGRGRGFRGRGRGGFNGPHADTQQDGGHNYEAPPQGRGGYNYEAPPQGRGGYNYEAPPQGRDGYNHEAPPHGRGRGRGRGNRGRDRVKKDQTEVEQVKSIQMAEIAFLGGGVVAASQSSLLLQPSKFGFHTLAPPSTSLLRLHQPTTSLFSSPNPKLHSSIFASKAVSSYSEATSSSSSTIINDNVDLSTEGIEIELDTGGGGSDGYKDIGGGGGGGGGDGGGGKNEGEGGSPDESGSEKKMALSMSQKLTLGYAALVGIGGAMGYMKSGSQKSLLAGGISASVLYYVYSQLPANPVYASSIGLGISAALMGVMGSRFLKSRKIFPAGVVSLVSFIMTGGYLHGILRSMH